MFLVTLWGGKREMLLITQTYFTSYTVRVWNISDEFSLPDQLNQSPYTSHWPIAVPGAWKACMFSRYPAQDWPDRDQSGRQRYSYSQLCRPTERTLQVEIRHNIPWEYTNTSNQLGIAVSPLLFCSASKWVAFCPTSFLQITGREQSEKVRRSSFVPSVHICFQANLAILLEKLV